MDGALLLEHPKGEGEAPENHLDEEAACREKPSGSTTVYRRQTLDRRRIEGIVGLRGFLAGLRQWTHPMELVKCISHGCNLLKRPPASDLGMKSS